MKLILNQAWSKLNISLILNIEIHLMAFFVIFGPKLFDGSGNTVTSKNSVKIRKTKTKEENVIFASLCEFNCL